MSLEGWWNVSEIMSVSKWDSLYRNPSYPWLSRNPLRWSRAGTTERWGLASLVWGGRVRTLAFSRVLLVPSWAVGVRLWHAAELRHWPSGTYSRDLFPWHLAWVCGNFLPGSLWLSASLAQDPFRFPLWHWDRWALQDCAPEVYTKSKNEPGAELSAHRSVDSSWSLQGTKGTSPSRPASGTLVVGPLTASKSPALNLL